MQGGFDIHVDLTQFRRSMSSIARDQMPYATALALNDTATDVKDAWEDDFDQHLDTPTPFTKRGVYVSRASKRRLMAEVGLKPVQAEYLEKQITGGTRRPKGKAIVMPAKIRLNKYGNIPRGAVARALSSGRAFATSRSQKTSLPPGVYQRMARGALKKLAGFEDRAEYQARLPLRRTAEAQVVARFTNHFAARFRAAIATAR